MPNRSAGGYLVIFASAYLVGYKIVSGAQNASRRADDKAERANHGVEFVQPSAGHFADKRRERQNEQRQRQEESYWRWTKIAAVVAAVGAIVAAGFAGFAFKEAQRQANAAEEANRPWLAVGEDAEPGSFIVQDGNLFVGMEIKVKNTGHSISNNVFVTSTIIPSTGAISISSTLGAFCKNSEFERRKKAGSLTDSEVIFPEVGFTTISVGTSVNIKSFVQEDINAVRKFFIEQMQLWLIKKHIEFKPIPDTVETHQVSDITVIGCITYQSVMDKPDSFHGTSFAFRVSKRVAANLESVQPFDLKKEGALAKSAIEITWRAGGSFAN